MRDHNEVDDIIIRVDDFVTKMISLIEQGGDFDLDITFDPDLDDSVPVSATAGNYIEGDLTVGDLRGMTVQEIIEYMLFLGQTDPQTAPTAALAGSGAKTIEVGITINPELTGNFVQNDGGAIDTISLERDDVEIATVNPYTDTGLTSATPTIFTYDMTFNYLAGPIPNDTQGNPDPSAQIPAGSVQTNDVDYEFIYPIFWGVSPDPLITQSDINAGTKVLSNDQTPTITFNSSSSEYSWIAVPSSFPDFTEWFVTDLNNGGIGAGQTFASPNVLSIDSPDAYWAGVNYKIYLTNFSTAFTEPVTFS